MQPDILVFMSDQHGAWAIQGNECPVHTPVLHEMRKQGVEFSRTYTPCPLCVPARMSMLSGLLPSKTGILLNDDTLPDTTPTFLHSLVAAGYETVLAGRMHFIGADQRHGFTKRIAPDITPVTWNRSPSQLAAERGVFAPTYAAKGCTAFAGGGESPVLRYDQMVVDAVLSYLAQPHEKPQFILVGTYAPHFPYVAPKDLYEKYRADAALNDQFYETPAYFNPCLRARQNRPSESVALAAQSAYYGMIERMDQQLGQVRDAWKAFCSRRESRSVFCYLSDHGDELGARGIFGKWNFFERSARVPFILEAPDLPAGRCVTSPTSLLDVGPTLCHLAGAKMPEGDGENLILKLQQKDWPQTTVVSQLVEPIANNGYRYAVMVCRDWYKWIHYHGYDEQDMLFDLKADPKEQHNLRTTHPEIAHTFAQIARGIADENAVEQEQKIHKNRADWFRAVEAAQGIAEQERWKTDPKSVQDYPEICVKQTS